MRDALEALLDAAGEAKAREILAEIARPAVREEFERIVAMRLVAQLREAHTARCVIRDRLLRRGYSRPTAYRLIEQVISAPPENCLTEGPSVRRDATKLST